MNKLLSVSRKRLFKDKIFYLAVIITLVISLMIILSNAPTMAEWVKAGDDFSLEECYFNFAPILGLVLASFVSLFLGVEHSDGTLRNKIISGHSRTSVFLSFFMVSALGSVIITSVWFVSSLPGLYYLDFSITAKTYVLWIIIALCSAVLYSAIFTTISMLVPNKAVGAVLSLVLWFVIMYSGSIVVGILSEPKTICDYVPNGDGFTMGDPHPNPDYVSGTKRIILQVINYILPSCPINQFSNGELMGKPVIYIISELVTTVLVLFFGCFTFNKKDLK